MRIIRNNSGNMFLLGSMGLSGIFFFKRGPDFSDDKIRYALAGAYANLVVESGMHAFDTVNMQSKVHDEAILKSSK